MSLASSLSHDRPSSTMSNGRSLRWAIRFLNDPRDACFLALMAKCALVACLGTALLFSGRFLWYLAPLYWLLQVTWVLDRFTLMLHCTSHRPLFRARYRRLNLVIPWVLCPFFGQTPNTYLAHHMGMHHREDNLHADLSTTMPFHRERFGHWLAYYGRFLTRGIFDLCRYLKRRSNHRLLRRVILGEGIFWAIVIALAAIRPGAVFVVIVGPLLVMRTLMMIGNWAQHSLVCPEQPGNPYRASITCINTRYNRRCFNDGYHVLHHVEPTCHWTEMPGKFERDLEKYGREDSIVFSGLDFFQVWLCLVTRRWSILSKAFVQLPGAPLRGEGEILQLLRDRLRPIAANSIILPKH